MLSSDLVIADEPESRSVELSPNITVELNDKNDMIEIEILKATGSLRACYKNPCTRAL